MTRWLRRRDVIVGRLGSGASGNAIGKFIIQIGTLSLPLWLLAGIASLLLGGDLGTLWMTSQLIPRPDTGPMSGVLNVLVASFGEQGEGPDSPIGAFEDGRELARDLVARLADERRWPPQLSPGDVRFRFVDQVIAGAPERRQEQAARLAAAHSADIVIHGYFTHGRQFVPELFVSPRLSGGEELYRGAEHLGQGENSGAAAFGEPIGVASWRFGDWPDRRSAVMARLGARFEALTRVLFGLALFKTGRYELAAGLLHRALTTPEAWRDQRGQPSEAGKEVVYLWIGTAAAEHARVSPGAPFACPAGVGGGASDAGKSDAGAAEGCAEGAYARALAIDGSYARARIGRGNIWFRRGERAAAAGETGAACAAFERARGAYAEALDPGQSFPRSAYGPAKAQLNLGLTLAHASRLGCGDPDQARAHLREALRRFREQEQGPDAPFLRYIGASALYQLGLLDLAEGRVADAAAALEATIASAGPHTPGEEWWRPIRWFAASQLGQAALEAGDRERAAAAYRQVVEAYGHGIFINDYVGVDAYHSLGAIYNRQERHDAAIAALERGLALMEQHIAPEDPYRETTIWTLRLELGDAYFNQAGGDAGLVRRAHDQYRVVVERFEPAIPDLTSQQYYTLGMAYCRLGRTLAAMGDQAAAAALAQRVAATPRLRGYEQTCHELRH